MAELESDHDRLVRLEEKLEAARAALELAQNNTHVVIAEVLSVLAVLISLYATFRR